MSGQTANDVGTFKRAFNMGPAATPAVPRVAVSSASATPSPQAKLVPVVPATGAAASAPRVQPPPLPPRTTAAASRNLLTPAATRAAANVAVSRAPGPARANIQQQPDVAAAAVNAVSMRPAIPIGKKISLTGAGGRSFDIVVGNDGKVAMSAPPPPVREITFSGGGGKGAALPGAVSALEEAGILKDVKVLNGASVGSMTAALVAAGITAEDFAKVSNDPTTGEAISEGRGAAGLLLKGILGSRLSGEGLEKLMRDNIGDSVMKQIEKYRKSQEPQEPDQQTARMLQGIEAKITANRLLSDNKLPSHPLTGVTFGDLRALSKIIPDIKELNIAGTYMADDSARPDGAPKGTMEAKGKPQLAMFNADTTPNQDIAQAVHASAALPPVFAQVDISLPSGITARFEDGGVMNNAPTSDLVGAKRSLDPMPTVGKMTFVFEGEDDVIQKGPDAVVPTLKRGNDHFSGAPNSAAEYEKKRNLAERPDEVVKVPLVFRMPAPNGGAGTEKNFSGFISGTLNMNMPVDDKVALQKNTKQATEDYLEQRKKPKTTTFSSVGQMLNSISDGDLEALVEAGFADAEAEKAFRSDVRELVEALEDVAAGAKPADLQDGTKVRGKLDGLDRLADGDKHRQVFVARELNRSGKLDPLMTLAESAGDQGLDVLKAGVAVQVGLKVQSRVQVVSRELIYPKMVKQDPTSVSGTLLRHADTALRSATTPEWFNGVLDNLIDHFSKKSDAIGWHEHAEFGKELGKYMFVLPPPAQARQQQPAQPNAVPPPRPKNPPPATPNNSPAQRSQGPHLKAATPQVQAAPAARANRNAASPAPPKNPPPPPPR